MEDDLLPSQIRAKQEAQRLKEETASGTGQDDLLPSQLRNGVPPPERGLPEDIAKSAGSGLVRGTTQVPGMVGGIGQAVELPSRGWDWLVAKAMEKTGMLPQGKTADDLLKASRELEDKFRTPAEQRGEVNRIAGVPFITPSGSMKQAEEAMPVIKPATQYKPSSVPGALIQRGTEAIPGAMVGPGGMVTKTIVGFGAGAGGEAADMWQGENYGPAASIVGSIVGGLTAAGLAATGRAMSTRAVQERADRIAGQILRESQGDPQAAKAALDRELAAMKADPERYVSGVSPKTAQVLRSGEIEGLEAQVLPNSKEAELLRRQEQFNRSRISEEAQGTQAKYSGAVPEPDMKAAVGLSGSNPQQEASLNARAMIDALEKAKDDAAKAAWQAPELKGITIHKDNAGSALMKWYNEQTTARQSAIPKEITDLFSATMAGPDWRIGLNQLQDLRSRILSVSREAYRKGDTFSGLTNSDFAAQIAKVLNNERNIVIPSGADAKLGQAAWRNAVAKTKDYYDTFRPEFMAKLATDTSPGIAKIPVSTTFDALFSGQNALRHLQEVRKAMGTAIDKDASDWLIGKLTRNGTNVNLKPEDVQRFLATGQNAAIVSEVPGLQQRMTELARRAGESQQAAMYRQALDGLSRYMDNPARLADYIAQHKATLHMGLSDPASKAYLDSLARSAKMLAPIRPEKAVSTQTLDRLAKGRIDTILYGKATGKLTDAAVTELLVRILGSKAGLALEGVGALAGATGSSKSITDRMAGVANRLIFGRTQEEAMTKLREALVNPELASKYMGLATAENIVGATGGQVAWDVAKKTGAAAARTGTKILNTLPFQADNQRGDEKAREGRATGGRVKNHQVEADRLIRLAEAHKKRINQSTEQILQTPDDHVAQALEVANRHI